MADQCKYLEYRRENDGGQFDTPRAYCTAADTFVQPMRADICNRRYALAPEADCEYYEAAESSETQDVDEEVEQ